MSIGSGVIIGDDLVLTCYHVVQGCMLAYIEVMFTIEINKFITDETEDKEIDVVLGQVVYVEPHLDLAIIRLRDIQMDALEDGIADLYEDQSGYLFSQQFGQQMAVLGHGSNVNFHLIDGIVKGWTTLHMFGDSYYGVMTILDNSVTVLLH